MQNGLVPQVGVAQVPADARLLDVREDAEWVAGHVEGALHVPMGEVVERFGEVSEWAGAGERVHVLCRSGGRSARVTQYLRQQGVDAVNVDGGTLAWADAGGRLVAESGEPPHVK